MGHVKREIYDLLYLTSTVDAIRIGIATSPSSAYTARDNITGISNRAHRVVNDFLTSKGKEPLDPKDPAQNIAALWLDASLLYDPDSSIIALDEI